MSYVSEVLADTPSLYWRCGDASSPLADTSGNGRTGTVTGGTFGQAGALTGDADQALLLDGNDDLIISSYNPFANSASRTFEGWAWRDATANTDCLFSSTGANEVYLRIAGGNENVDFDPLTGAGAAQVTWAGVFPTAQWVHWVFTFVENGGGANNAELFINGSSVGTKTVDSYGATPGNFQVGRRGGGSDYFGGKFDEVAIYESILSPTRIGVHYDIGVNGPPVAPPTLRVVQSSLRFA